MKYLFRYIGGPHPCEVGYDDAVAPVQWPPYEYHDVAHYLGRYRLVRYSDLPQDVVGMIRGAEYEWEPR